MQLEQEEMMNKKAKQILHNARKSSANQAGSAAQHQQQLYLNSVNNSINTQSVQNLQNRPHTTLTSHSVNNLMREGPNNGQQQITQNRKMELAAHREQHSKSAVGMMGGNASNGAQNAT